MQKPAQGQHYADIALGLPSPVPFQYEIPENLSARIQTGQRVWVRVRERKLVGYVVGFSDQKAFEEIKPFTDLPDSWVSKYYLEIESQIHINPSEAIINDTKIQNIRGMKCAIGQLELWNSRHFLEVYATLISATLREFGTELWFFNSPCISEGRNYIFTKNKTVKDLLSGVMDIRFEGNIGITSKLWLRKEILKMIQ